MNNSVIVQGVSKQYGSKKQPVVALSDISLDIATGELFGLIGPDGAGKTSLFRILTTLLLADKGSATVAGYDVVKEYKAVRKIVGYMPGKFSLYQDLTVEENLHFFATIFHASVADNYHLIKDIYEQIAPFKDRRAGKLSGGMKQKLALCCALIHEPKVLFLDEPTTGVDAVSRNEFWDMLQLLKMKGITIIVSTPYMDEASRCDRVALIQNGRILQVNTPEAIISGFTQPLYAVKAPGMLALLKQLHNTPGVLAAYPFGEYHHAVMQPGVTLPFLGKDAEVKAVTPNIEDCFIQLMQHHA